MTHKALLAELVAQQKVTNDLLRALIDHQTIKPPTRPAKKGT